MIYRPLGNTGLDVSILGLGTGGSSDPLGQQSGAPEAEIHRFIHHAIEFGINHIDTAPGYRNSEEILGRALAGGWRDRVLLSTKMPLAGAMPGKPVEVMGASEIAPAIERSLLRLRTDRVDILHIAVEGPQHLDIVLNEHLPELNRLKEQGKFRFLGSTEMSRADGSHQWLRALLPIGCLDVAMVAHNLINQSAQDTVFPLCSRLGVGVLNVFTIRNVFGRTDRLIDVVGELVRRGVVEADAVDLNDPLGWLLWETDAGNLAEVALRFAAHTEGVSAIMHGSHRTGRLETNFEAIQKGPLPPEAVSRLRRIFRRVEEPVGN